MPMLQSGGYQSLDGIICFDAKIVVLPVGIVLRAAPAAIVERQHAPGCLRLDGKIHGKLMEIARIARQAGKADDRNRIAILPAVTTAGKLQTIGSRVGEFPPVFHRSWINPCVLSPVLPARYTVFNTTAHATSSRDFQTLWAKGIGLCRRRASFTLFAASACRLPGAWVWSRGFRRRAFRPQVKTCTIRSKNHVQGIVHRARHTVRQQGPGG